MRNKIYVLLLGVMIPLVVYAGLESSTYIDGLVSTNPLSTDPAHQGDDHLRLIKSTIKNTFPNINAAVTYTDEQFNNLPRKDTANTFTEDQTINDQLIITGPGGEFSLYIQNSTPNIRFEETDAAANNKKWGIEHNAEQWFVQTISDDELTAVKAITIDRTGTAVDEIDLTATNVRANNRDVVTGTTNSMKMAAMKQTNAGNGCTVGRNYGVTSCSWSSTGSYSVDITAAGFTATPVCTITKQGAGSEAVVENSSTSISVSTFFHDGTLLNALWSMTCVGP